MIKDDRMWEKLIALVWFEANGKSVAEDGAGLDMDVRVTLSGIDKL